MAPDPDETLHLFQAVIRRTGPGKWSESYPQSCFRGHDLTRPRSMLVGWDSSIDPPHRIWVCRTCGDVIHNLAADQYYETMRPVRLDHCDPHQPADGNPRDVQGRPQASRDDLNPA